MEFLVVVRDADNRYFADTQIADSSDAACAAATAVHCSGWTALTSTAPPAGVVSVAWSGV